MDARVIRRLQPTRSSSTFLLVELALREPGEHVLLGDFNLHHPKCNNPGRCTYHALVHERIAITKEKGLKIMYQRTWSREDLRSTKARSTLSSRLTQLKISISCARRAKTSAMLRSSVYLHRARFENREHPGKKKTCMEHSKRGRNQHGRRKATSGTGSPHVEHPGGSRRVS